MSRQSSSRKPKSKATANPEPDIYVGLLAVAVSALFVGILFFVLELGRYNWQLPT